MNIVMINCICSGDAIQKTRQNNMYMYCCIQPDVVTYLSFIIQLELLRSGFELLQYFNNVL